MLRSKRYEIKRGCLFYREDLAFKTIIHETMWRILMKAKGYKIKELLKN
ncbi:hypothetical protein CLPU_10c01340 [Gottschalkia purinilytica]|uniref:Uncharacterized protein n=1 Tax=Gottschalkia purinilytica TaxID=1503 RepID=A0A0L0W958_GOTPU|nr:hypothetical protein CLPU_10c01340 [Gottschalkia purinilytica]